MLSDPSWDVMPVTNPDLAERKQRRLVRNNLVTDPVGLAEPLYQLRHRDEIVAPSAVIEIGGLAAQASAAAQAVRESMHQVGLAAAALAQPESATG